MPGLPTPLSRFPAKTSAISFREFLFRAFAHIGKMRKLRLLGFILISKHEHNIQPLLFQQPSSCNIPNSEISPPRTPLLYSALALFQHANLAAKAFSVICGF
jgi:SNF2 family DNA or RNA helicase